MRFRKTTTYTPHFTEMFSVPLLFLDRPRKVREVLLHYDFLPAGTQRRLKDRLAVVPRVNLDDFDVKAVVDYLDIELQLSRTSQGRHVATELFKIDDQKVYAEALPEKVSETSDKFRIRFQECTAVRLKKSIEALEAKWGIISSIRVVEIEVSIDFYPKTLSEENVDLISGTLKRHFMPDRKLLKGKGKAPRYALIPSDGGGKAQFISRKKKDGLGPDVSTYSAVAIDRTLYFGQKDENVSWRVQRKDTDSRNGEDHIALPPQQHRGRIEVTLRGGELRKLGLIHAEDLFDFKFVDLRPLYFNFHLCTMPDVYPQIGAAIYASRIREESVFGIGGIYAHDHWWRKMINGRQTVRRRRDKAIFPATRRKRLSQRAKRLTALSNQKNGNLLAYEKLNVKSEQALRQLSRMWSK